MFAGKTLLGQRLQAGRIASGVFRAAPGEPRDSVDYVMELDLRQPLAIALAWSLFVATLALTGLLSAGGAALLVLLAALCFVMRQREVEWVHDLIGRAAKAVALEGNRTDPNI